MATASVSEVVVGSDRVDLFITFTDQNDLAININGATELKCQGQSEDLPGIDLNLAGTIQDAAGGVAKFQAFGNAVTVANLGSLPSALFSLRGKLKDSTNLTTFTPIFQVRFMHQPL